jgi:hypothetical protein
MRYHIRDIQGAGVMQVLLVLPFQNDQDIKKLNTYAFFVRK